MLRPARSFAGSSVGLSSGSSVALVAGVVGWLTLGAGCGESEPAGSPVGAAAERAGDAAGFDPNAPEWSVTVPAARAPVQLRDYQSAAAAAASPGREMLERADVMKASGQYDVARSAYELALKQDPNFAQAAYQLACNEALAEHDDAARAAFERALDLGFDDYPVARIDGELGPLREDADFPDRLREIRRRYFKAAAERVGTPFYLVPADLTADQIAGAPPPPAGGGDKPPVILLLHGYGDSHESYVGEALAWAKLGWAAVCVPGSLPTAGGGFLWPTDEASAYQTVHRQLRAILDDPGLGAVADVSRAALLGFSQGANQAAALLARHPDVYLGAVALSPGGRPTGVYEPGALDATGPRPLAMFYGDEEGGEPVLVRWQTACEAAGWPTYIEEFPGGHHFPRDWQEKRRTRIAAFLLGERGD